jgi:hypothetical protein
MVRGFTEESVRDAFELIYFPDQPDAFTDDEIFGTKEAKGIGDSWSINPALLSASLKGIRVDLGSALPGHPENSNSVSGVGR